MGILRNFLVIYTQFLGEFQATCKKISHFYHFLRKLLQLLRKFHSIKKKINFI